MSAGVPQGLFLTLYYL